LEVLSAGDIARKDGREGLIEVIREVVVKNKDPLTKSESVSTVKANPGVNA
jgi:hypothetical protein